MTAVDHREIVTLLKQDKQLKAITSIFTREYWTRLWIIQEFLMARDFIIQCGRDTCSRFSFCSFLDAIEDGVDKRQTDALKSWGRVKKHVSRLQETIPARLVRQRRRADARALFKDYGSRPVPQRWFKLYEDYKTAKCEDPWDKIFGLQTLAYDCCKQEIPVDYSLSWQQVLGNLVRHQISQHITAPKSLNFQISAPKYTVKKVRQIYCEAAEAFSQYDRADLLAKLKFDFDDFVEKIEDVKPNAFTTVRGYIRGRIYFTSPALSEAFSTKDFSVPHLTTWTEIQLRHICGQFERRESGSTTGSKLVSLETPSLGSKACSRHPHVTSELSIFAPTNARLDPMSSDSQLKWPTLSNLNTTQASSYRR
jgi:hypothetical protein